MLQIQKNRVTLIHVNVTLIHVNVKPHTKRKWRRAAVSFDHISGIPERVTDFPDDFYVHAFQLVHYRAISLLRAGRRRRQKSKERFAKQTKKREREYEECKERFRKRRMRQRLKQR